MARLAKWAESALKVVDEKGDSTARIRLISADGSTWETWDAPFDEPDQWVSQAEALLSELAEDFGGEMGFLFVAESQSGTIRSQCAKRIQGKQRKNAAGNFFGGQQNGLQSMYDAQARTTEKTLQSANVQLEVLTKTVETQAKANAELLDYIRAQNEREALAQSENTTKEMLGQLFEQAPLLVELLKVASTKKAAAAGVGATAKDTLKAAAVEAASNGASQLVSNALTPKGN